VAPRSLDQKSLGRAVSALVEKDARLARIHRELGPPPLWAREPGFPTLVSIILEQQVSLASARAAWLRLQASTGTLTPEAFLALNDGELKRIGFSRQKAAYCRGLARSVLDRELALDDLPRLDDEAARSALVRIKGIGPWTADIYLMEALLRPDVWPAGDIALATAYQECYGLASRPTPDRLEKAGNRWRPWRSVAARLLWHQYLSARRPLFHP
jgi:DNA-3-methyladenine glycosylase II